MSDEHVRLTVSGLSHDRTYEFGVSASPHWSVRDRRGAKTREVECQRRNAAGSEQLPCFAKIGARATPSVEPNDSRGSVAEGLPENVAFRKRSQHAFRLLTTVVSL